MLATIQIRLKNILMCNNKMRSKVIQNEFLICFSSFIMVLSIALVLLYKNDDKKISS